MADAWRSSGRPTLRLKPKINQVKSLYYSEATTTNERRKVDSLFQGLESCVGVLEDNFLDNDRFQGVQQLLPSRRMVINVLCKLHDRVNRRLRPTPRLADPWSEKISLDLPMELFAIIAKEIIEQNSHGHTMSRETGTTVTYTFSTFGEAKFVFARMNLDGVITQPEHLLKKQLSSQSDPENLERVEVIVNADSPMVWKYHKSKEILFIKFKYGYWNRYGISQH